MISITAWPPVIEQWRDIVTDAADRYRLDDDLIAAVIWHESAGDPAAERYEPYWDVTSYGLMQIVDFDWRDVTPEQLLNPDFNVNMGAYILSVSIKQGGSVRYGLGLYNCSLASLSANRCRADGGLVYADAVIAACRKFGGCRPPTMSRHFVQ